MLCGTLRTRENAMNQVSKRLQKALEAAKAWPPQRQDAAADLLEQLDRLESEPYELSAEERANIEEPPDGVRRGEFATDAEVAAIFARYDS